MAGIARTLIFAGIALVVAMVVYIMVTNMYQAQNRTMWDPFAITFFSSMGPMLLLLIAVIVMLALAVKAISKEGEGL
jgi:uncharacterized membrane protein